MKVKFIDTQFFVAICVTFDPDVPIDDWIMLNRQMILTDTYNALYVS